MEIILENIGKKYHRKWIFRQVNLSISGSTKLAIIGHNGSGKSTLLKIIGGFTLPSEGKVLHSKGEENALSFSMAAPYMNLIEEFTLTELLDFHGRFKRQLKPTSQILGESGLETATHKMIREFSSGMKQRLRLALAFFFESAVLLLDEPTANLDQEGVHWYGQLIRESVADRALIIASNQESEYACCDQKLDVSPLRPELF